MNNQEAKFILSAYRPSGEDACAAAFAAALEQVNRDPDLAAWFAGQRALDVATTNAICSIAIPQDLRANILAGAKISRRRFWGRRPALLAIAASLVFFAVITDIWMRPSHLDPWQNDALAAISKFVPDQDPFDHIAADSRELQQWLQAHNAAKRRSDSCCSADSSDVRLQNDLIKRQAGVDHVFQNARRRIGSFDRDGRFRLESFTSVAAEIRQRKPLGDCELDRERANLYARD